jgi:hypothetical protein
VLEALRGLVVFGIMGKRDRAGIWVWVGMIEDDFMVKFNSSTVLRNFALG